MFSTYMEDSRYEVDRRAWLEAEAMPKKQEKIEILVKITFNDPNVLGPLRDPRADDIKSMIVEGLGLTDAEAATVEVDDEVREG